MPIPETTGMRFVYLVAWNGMSFLFALMVGGAIMLIMKYIDVEPIIKGIATGWFAGQAFESTRWRKE